ncbi:DUF5672 family protein [Pedobacter agri]|uniref:DUF5672 family protein n=1 Tax=Pedobacter agri TaxID=454586 RepID=UPI000E2634F3|nr:DUF5672 family protein [Pedobacter agri]
MSSNQTNAIVIPIYKESLSVYEQISLEQCFRIFKGLDIVAVKPVQLQTTDKRFTKVITFENAYFENVFGYNRLMLSSTFYAAFQDYPYILIYQLDAFVFSNQLDYWCSKKYDYIGAPWFYDKGHQSTFKKLKEAFRSYWHRRYNIKGKDGKPALDKQLNKMVGNGGFSLRKTDTFFKICEKYKTQITEYEDKENSIFNEDIFFSIELNRKTNTLKIPSYKEAVNFAIETCPEIAIELTDGKLPFGCHAWEKNLKFWKDKIEDFHYKLT